MEIAGVALAATSQLLWLIKEVKGMVERESKVQYEVPMRLLKMDVNVGLLKDTVKIVQKRQMQNIEITKFEGVQNWMDKTVIEAREGQAFMQILRDRSDHYTNRRKKSGLYRMFCIVHKPFISRRIGQLRVREEQIMILAKKIRDILSLTDGPGIPYEVVPEYEPVYQEIPFGCSPFGILKGRRRRSGYDEIDEEVFLSASPNPARFTYTGR